MLKLEINLDFKNYSLSIEEEVQKGGVLGLLGKSGIGKSTVLKVIAGLQKTNQSTVSYNGKIWNDSSTRSFVPSKDRAVGLVFQDFALFPNLTVRENLAYAQKISNTALDELVSILDISDILNKKSNEISGGQKQRTAIGRAIAYNPDVLLMDEPFAALDDEIKFTIKSFLKTYLIDHNKIAIIVSHDQSDLTFFTNQIIKLQER